MYPVSISNALLIFLVHRILPFSSSTLIVTSIRSCSPRYSAIILIANAFFFIITIQCFFIPNFHIIVSVCNITHLCFTLLSPVIAYSMDWPLRVTAICYFAPQKIAWWILCLTIFKWVLWLQLLSSFLLR